ncbi:YaaR family protein [Cytobacillus purgationiresistens]|uniref:Uncharacterized protein YaaR (DUF327 family) n=1 Tax=Cytobacillus purgationiresistens TaxID=863449 RepID=A0ABU0APD7_9BACI|nr:YaaR family protein [Cytobacillus purgationiresistens]MDQ0273122.1 uncharacterized protein YaaR (DUF327 family) [Cytobacillus purgationiresistens]
MKINQDIRLNVDKVRQDQKQPVGNQLKFNELVQKHGQKMQTSQMHALLGDIESAGRRLARSRSFKDMAKYKTLVKKFIKETVEYGMELKQSHSWNHLGQGKALKIVETIDERLAELAKQILQQEGDSIDILGKIGEIKGLLINLYT